MLYCSLGSLLNTASNRSFPSFGLSLNSTKVFSSFPIFRKNLLPFPAPPDCVAQAWQMTTETMALSSGAISRNVLEGVFISASVCTQGPRAYKHKIREAEKAAPRGGHPSRAE